MTKIKVFTIDMTKIDSYEPISRFEDKLFSELKKRDLLDGSRLYTIVDGERIPLLKIKGTYTKEDTIYAFQRDQLRWDSDNSVDQTLKRYLREYDNPALAVWDARQFMNERPLEYKFIRPDRKIEALEGIAKLRMAA